MECDTSDISVDVLLHRYTRETPIVADGARAIGNLFERHDARDMSRSTKQRGERTPAIHRMATRPAWNSAESEMRRLGRATTDVAEKTKNATRRRYCIEVCKVLSSHVIFRDAGV